MTDDFHLFGDPDDGDRPIDPDLALVSAYLARELSPMQVLALEERLATDAHFRERMQPLFDAWAAPVASLDGGAARRALPLSAVEREAGWRRLRHDSSQSMLTTDVTHRRNRMKRVAAVVALIVVPMGSFAQVVMHAARNPEARGHALARRIVAPFAGDEAAPTAGARLSEGSPGRVGTASPLRIDTSALLPVPAAPVVPLESESISGGPARRQPAPASPTIAPSRSSLALPSETQARKPNRARVVEMARANQARVTSGDTAADYIVMVMDAAERYVWSTFGSGNALIAIAGDTRTAAERAEYMRTYAAEFRGGSAAAASVGESGTRTASPRIRVDSAVRRSAVAGPTTPDDSAAALARLEARLARIRRAESGGLGIVADSAQRAVDQLAGARRQQVVGATTNAEGGRRVMASGAAAAPDSFGSRMASVAAALSEAERGYRSGSLSPQLGPEVNEAFGMVQLGEGRSGIEGLPATAVAGADTYVFAPGELAPGALRVIVVHLVPGAVFVPR